MKIFISYSWKEEKIVDKLDDLFSYVGITLVRDKREIEYKDNIPEFMNEIRSVDYAILLISKKYLESDATLYEVCEVVKDKNYFEKILPLVMKGVDIFSLEGRESYVEYWESKQKELELKSNNLNILDTLDRVKMINANLPEFLVQIKNHKMINCSEELIEKNFKEIAQRLDLDISSFIVWEKFKKDVLKWTEYIDDDLHVEKDILSKFETEYIEDLKEENKNIFFRNLWVEFMNEEDKKQATLLYNILNSYIIKNLDSCINNIEDSKGHFKDFGNVGNPLGCRDSPMYNGFSKKLYLFFNFPKLYEVLDDEDKLEFKEMCKLDINHYVLAYFVNKDFKTHLEESKKILNGLSKKDKHKTFDDYTKINITLFLTLYNRLKQDNFSIELINAFILECIIGSSKSYGYSEEILEKLLPNVIDSFSSSDIKVLIDLLESNNQYQDLGKNNDYSYKIHNNLWDYMSKHSEIIIDKLGTEFIQSEQNTYIYEKLKYTIKK